jgi:hypothetical protein
MFRQKHLCPLPLINCGFSLKVDTLRIVNHRARNLKDCLFPRKFARRPGNPVSSYLPDPLDLLICF